MKTHSRQRKLALLLASLLLIAATPLPESVFAVTQTAKATAEQYVLEQVIAGKPAQLAVQFPDEKARVLSALFLTKLLTIPAGKLQVHPHGVMIDGAIIAGQLDLINEEIPYDTILTNCHFQGDVNLTQSRFAKSLNLSNSIFEANTDFESATITFDLNVEHGGFASEVFFKSLHAGGDLLLNYADFKKAANFSEVEVGGNMLSDHAKFYDTADFDNLKVKGDASFRDNEFHGRVSFDEARFTNLFLTGCLFLSSTEHTDFTRMKMESGFLENTRFNDRIKIDGISFQYLSPASWETLQTLANHSEYNAEFYSSLEALFQRHGYPDQANKVFIAQKQRERGERLHGLEWLWNFMQDLLVGYGRRLERLLLWSGVLVLVGCIVFRKESEMKTIDPADQQRCAGKYNAFWYSLDLFLPILTLGDKTTWAPKDDRRLAQLYRRVHIILGHLLVPIGLAAWAGIIK
jgi:hypothetical protein